MHVHYCPACGEEFRPEVVRCSDCGAVLEDRYDEAPVETAAPEPEPALPPGAYDPVFDAVDSAALKEAAACLAAAGIPFQATGSSSGFRLLVRSEERAAAAAALSGREGTVSPTTASPSAPGEETDRCPACGALLVAGLVECPGCQLVVGGGAGACARCASALGPADTRCPVCGAPIAE